MVAGTANIVSVVFDILKGIFEILAWEALMDPAA
jgi:hypothetical protein